MHIDRIFPTNNAGIQYLRMGYSIALSRKVEAAEE
jgi:hypothetical protein